MSSSTVSWLICICVVQFLVIVHLIGKSKDHGMDSHEPVGKIESFSKRVSSNSMAVVAPSLRLPGFKYDPLLFPSKKFGGVAATLLLHAPSWFQRRYTMMIQNALNNIPDDWVVQIFYTTTGQSQHGLDINPGIRKWVNSGKVVLSPIPDYVLVVKKKRFEMMFDTWIWESMLAEKVLIFGGNSVICSNSPWTFLNFTQFDYIGAPWDFKKGVGGDGGISLRSKSAMLAAIEYQLSHEPTESAKLLAFRKWGQEDQFYVRTLLEMNEKGIFNNNTGFSSSAGSLGDSGSGTGSSTAVVSSVVGVPWKLASREDTLRFGAIGSAVNRDVLVVSGILPGVPLDDRQKFMFVCPEIKMFYPALHDPSCFGAQPNGEECAKTICALKSKKERKGGC
jgi:hypothetical protein